MTYTLADRAAAEGRPMLEVRRVALNDGSHASLILENGRISKLVSPSGEVARLHWEEDKPSPRQPLTAMHHQPEIQTERCDAPPMQEKKTFVSARQFWANMPEASKAPGKNEASARGRSSVVACSTSGASDSSEVTSPSPRVPGKAPPSPSARQPLQPEEFTTAEPGTSSSGRTQETAEGSYASLKAQDSVQHFLGSSKEHDMGGPRKPPSQDEAQAYPSVPDHGQASTQMASCHTEGGLATAEEQDSADSSSTTAEAHANSASNDVSCSRGPKLAGYAPADHASLSHDCAEPQQDGAQPCLEAHLAGASKQQAASASVEVGNRHSAARDTLEALMGDTPRIDMRRMRAEVATLPQLVSAAERAKMAAGKRVKRSSRAGMQPPAPVPEQPAAPGAQPLPPGPEPPAPDAAAAQRPAHSAGEAWPPRAALFEDYPASPRPAANAPVALTAQQHARRRGAGSPAEVAGRGSAGVSSGELVDSPADAGDKTRAGTSGNEPAVGDSAAGLSADSVSSAARRRHSLADIRRAIAAIPSNSGAQGHSASVDLAAALLVPADPSNSKDLQTKVQKKSAKTVWRKITAAFASRRVQPQASSDTGSPTGSLGARPGSSSSGSSCTKRSLAQRLFGDRGFVRRASACSEAHVPVPTGHMPTPAAVPPAPVECALPLSPPLGGTDEPRGVGRTGQVAQETVTSSTVNTPSSARRRALHHGKAPCTRTGMAGRWLMEPCEGALAGMEAVETLLDLPLLQRLALHRAVELEILETDESLEIVQDIPLNVGGTRIRRRSLYPKSGAVVEETRTDSREGVLRSQLTVSPDGHCHIRSLQGEPYAAVFHKRIKMSSGGHRIKIEQKFQLLAPGVLPIKYHSIWHRVEEENAGGRSGNGK